MKESTAKLIRVKFADILLSTHRIVLYNLPKERKKIEKFKGLIKKGHAFPPIRVYKKGDKYQLHDGAHRYIAQLELAGKINKKVTAKLYEREN